jgi:hypothetical protein
MHKKRMTMEKMKMMTVNQDTNDNSNGSTFTVTIPENAAWSESINQRTFAPLL